MRELGGPFVLSNALKGHPMRGHPLEADGPADLRAAPCTLIMAGTGIIICGGMMLREMRGKLPWPASAPIF
ncbi:MAG: hypothetical protein ACK6DB_02005, partial [Planctomycetota bacterium]